MANMNIRVDDHVKEQAEALFSALGMNVTTAINIFLRQAVRDQKIPFEIKLDRINPITLAAIDEGFKLAQDDKANSYKTIDSLKEALDI